MMFQGPEVVLVHPDQEAQVEILAQPVQEVQVEILAELVQEEAEVELPAELDRKDDQEPAAKTAEEVRQTS